MKFEGMVVHYNHWWVERWIKAVAICFGKHVFTSREWLSERVLAHEYCHVAQYEVYGFWGYLVRWFYWTWKVGYHKNPFELQAEAYANVMCPPPPMPEYPDWLGIRWVALEPLADPAQGELWPY